MTSETGKVLVGMDHIGGTGQMGEILHHGNSMVGKNLGQISLGLRMGGTAVQQPTSKASESQSTFSMKVAGLLFNVVLNDNVTSPSILIIRPVEFMGAFLASALIVLGTLRLGRVFNVCLLLAMLISSGFRCCLHWCQIESSLNSKIEFEV